MARKEPEDSFWQRSFGMVRRFFVPTSVELLRAAEKSILSRFVRAQPEHGTFKLKSGEYLNFIEIKKENNTRNQSNGKPGKTLLLMHGFGSGLGMFFSNYDALSSEFDRVIAVDWLGMGGSSRPCCYNSPRMPLFGKWMSFQPMHPTKATDFFIDSLEEFRLQNEVSDFVLAGHSLGGYLCTRYAMKYPQAGVQALVLISPAGLVDIPPVDLHVPRKELSASIRLLDCMWNSNFTPQQIVRALGPKGPDVVLSAVTRRFGPERWSVEDAKLVADYLYHINAAPASGEYAMNSLLQPIVSRAVPDGESDGTTEIRRITGVYAREPVSPATFSKSFAENSGDAPPVLIIYGDHDWLSFPTVGKYVQDLNGHGVDASVVTVPEAGHHLYMDNASHFHKELFDWLRVRI